MQFVMDENDWLDEIAARRYEWTRVGPTSLEAMLRPDLPCRIIMEYVGDDPVLYVSIGINGTVNYWQWATVNQHTSEPLPKVEAIDQFWRILDLAMVTSKSRVAPQLLMA